MVSITKKQIKNSGKETKVADAGEDGKKRECLHTFGGNIIGAPTVEKSMEVSQKTKSRTTI